MANDFHLSVVAPDKSVVEEVVRSLVAPGAEGYFGVQAGHIPMVAALRPGQLEYTDHGGNRHYVYVGGGFTEVQGGRVTVLADEAQKAQEIDIAQAEKALEAARASLRGNGTMPEESAVLEIERAMSRIRAARSAR